METVLGRSALGGRGSFGAYKVVLKRVLTKVDLPKPDSPVQRSRWLGFLTFIPPGKPRPGRGTAETRTNYHHGELEALLDRLPVDLVGEVCEADIAHEFLANDGWEAGSRLLRQSAG